MASIVGTTGAAMILIRPLLRANRGRASNVHVIIFFIILVANVGGALTPLGDPPLFVGFLHGVSFFWTAQHLWLQTPIVATACLRFSSRWISGSRAATASEAPEPGADPRQRPRSISSLMALS